MISKSQPDRKKINAMSLLFYSHVHNGWYSMDDIQWCNAIYFVFFIFIFPPARLFVKFDFVVDVLFLFFEIFKFSFEIFKRSERTKKYCYQNSNVLSVVYNVFNWSGWNVSHVDCADRRFQWDWTDSIFNLQCTRYNLQAAAIKTELFE